MGLLNTTNNINQSELISENLDSKNISKSDFDKICTLEQDMWAREEGLGEYVECNGCGKIHSKQDIFYDLSKDIYSKTVSEIEQILSLDTIKCMKCGDDTKHIYGDKKHRQKILSRYKNSEAYIRVLRDDKKGDIKGFMDGYIDSFDTIYDRELQYHYSDIGKEALSRIIEEKIGGNLPKKLLSYSALGTEEKYMNLYTIFRLLTDFFDSIPKEKQNILGITELNAGKTLHALYNGLGIIQLNMGVQTGLNKSKITKNYNSDIFLQTDISKNGDYFNMPVSVFLKKNIKSIKQILNKK